MSSEITQISIVGSGNVAQQLAMSFKDKGIQITAIYSRNETSRKELATILGAEEILEINQLPQQLCILCIPDDAISNLLEDIAGQIPVAYTSGAVNLVDLPARKELGVFYPLQTFTKGRLLDLSNVPFFIESNSDSFTSQLFDLAYKISSQVSYANSEKRSEMHLSAIFVNNFTNHIIYLAQEIAEKNELDFKYFQPLLEETIAKLKENKAFNIQTGPAKRKDFKVISQQSLKLKGSTKTIYDTITASILKTYSQDDKL